MNTNCSLCGRPRTLVGGAVGCWRCDRADLWPTVCPEVDPAGYARKSGPDRDWLLYGEAFHRGGFIDPATVEPVVDTGAEPTPRDTVWEPENRPPLDLNDPAERGDPR